MNEQEPRSNAGLKGVPGRGPRVLAAALFAVALPIVLIGLNLSLLLSDRFVESEYSKSEFPKSEVFSPAERSEVSQVVISYLRGQDEPDALSSIRTGGGERVFSEREVSHLVDVKRVMDRVFILANAALILAAISIVIVWMATPSGYQGAGAALHIAYGSILALILLGLMALVTVLSFDWLFMSFHEAFFPPGSFLFAPEDSLIQLYPEQFWIDATFRLAGWTVLESGLLIAAGLGAYRLTRRRVLRTPG